MLGSLKSKFHPGNKVRRVIVWLVQRVVIPTDIVKKKTARGQPDGVGSGGVLPEHRIDGGY